MRFCQASLAFKEVMGGKNELPIILGPAPINLVQKLDLNIKS
jgi:hypothetical protein